MPRVLLYILAAIGKSVAFYIYYLIGVALYTYLSTLLVYL